MANSHPERSDLALLAKIGRALLEAQLDETQLCELIYQLAGQIVSTDNFQLGLFDGDRYQIQVWTRNGTRRPPEVFVVPEGHGFLGWLRGACEPLLVRDFAAEKATLPAQPVYEATDAPRSAIFLPLPVADTIIGAIVIQSQHANAFDERDLPLLTILAHQSAGALNNARLYARGQRRLNDLTAVAEVSSRINSILDLDELLTAVVRLIQSRLGYYHAQIFLVERGSDRAHFRASSGHGLNEKWRSEGRSMRIGHEGIVGWVAEHRQPLLANDVSLEPHYIADDPRMLPYTRAELAVPLIVEEEVVGVLDVQSTQLGAFGPDDLFVLRTLADQVAVAVNSARAYIAQREEAWVTTVMLQVAEVTSQAAGVEAVLEAAVRVTAMLAGVDSCTIWLWTDEFDAFQYGASYGANLRNVANPKSTLRFLAGDWDAFDRLRRDKSPLVLDLAVEPLPERLQPLYPGDVVVLLPMLNQGEVFGVMGISMLRERSPVLNERRTAMLAGIARQVAASVDNSRLAAAQQEESWVSTVLLQVAEAIARFQPINEMLSHIVRLTPLLAGVDRCAVLLMNEAGHYQVRTAYALRSELANPYLGAVVRPGDLPLLDEACRLGQPLVVDDASSSPKIPPAWRERFASRTMLVMPLLIGDIVIGAVLADDVDSTHMFSPRRVRILNGIASQTAVAIENARLQNLQAEQVRFNRELELARAIQRSLVPQQSPQIPGYEIVFRWQPAGEVGGDFFDFMSLPRRRLGLLVADVSDKGIPAALYMMFARTLMRAVAFSGRPPAAMLERANELIVSDSTSDMFVTTFYSVLQPDSHTVTYASAGHNLALYAEPGVSACSSITTAGLALGIIAPVEIEQKTVHLGPGAVLLYYTDGLTDALNAQGEEYGEARLCALLDAHRHEPAAAIADRVESAVRDFSAGTAQYDDMTMVIVKRLE